MLWNCGVGEDSWESPWTARRSNQSILKEMSLGCSLEGLMLKLKLQYFGHLMRESWFIWKDPNAGKDWGEGDDRGWSGWMILLTWWSWVWASSGRWWRTGKPGVLQSTRLQRVGHNLATEQHIIMLPWSSQSIIGTWKALKFSIIKKLIYFAFTQNSLFSTFFQAIFLNI